jgi:hypothetical protein
MTSKEPEVLSLARPTTRTRGQTVDGGRIIDGRKVVLTPSRAALHEHEHRAEQDGANRRHDP